MNVKRAVLGLFVLGLFVLMSSFAAGQVGVWTPRNEGLFGAWTLALATSSDGAYTYAGTNFGVFRSSDGGQAWVQLLGVNASTNAVAVNPGSSNIVFAGTEGQGIYLSTDFGDTWSTINFGLTVLDVQALAIDPRSPQTIYAATRGGGVYRSTDNGANWAQQNEGLNGLDVRALAIDLGTPGVILAGAQDGVYRSSDDGAHWTAMNSGLNSCCITSLMIIPGDSPTLLAGTQDGVYRSLNGGNTWTKRLDTGANGAVRALAMDPRFSNTVYAGIFCNGIYKSTDSGDHWSREHFSGCVSALSIDPDHMYAGSWGNPNALFASSDGGASWEPTSVFAVPVLSLSVNPADTNTVYAGTMNDFFTSDNEGDNWVRTPSTITHVRAIVSDPQSPNTIYVGGDRGNNAGVVYRSRDGGIHWEPVTHEIAATNVYAVALGPGNPDIIYAGTPSGVYRSMDDGDSWTNVTHGITQVIWALAVDLQNTVYAGTDAGIFKSTSAGDQWETLGLAQSRINAIAVDPWCPDVVYAGTNGGGIYRSVDGGHNWQAANNGLNSYEIQSIAVNASAPNVIYTTTWAGVARSQDFGGNWVAFNEGLANVGVGPLLVVAKYPEPSTVFVAGMNHVFAAQFMDVPHAVLTWANPADIVYGTPLGASQLNATANVAGTFVYTPAAGTILNVGNGQTLSVKFTPAGASDCYSVRASVRINVLTSGQATARMWIGLKNSDDVGTKFDLLAEVFRNGLVVGSGQLDGVSGGSSGFNNAVLRTINLALSSPVNLSAGDTLSIRLSVRIAVAVSGHRSGTARLWFNDAQANSRFGATVDGVTSDYFLLDGFTLGAAAGPGPKKTIDVFVDRLVGGNPFKPFGTWSKTF